MRIIPKSIPECLLYKRALLGESPVWSIDEQCLYWVDIEGRTFNRFDPKNTKNVAIDTGIRVSALALRSSGGFIVATEFGFQFSISGGMLEENPPNGTVMTIPTATVVK